jgi:hypothetical protein
VRLLRCVALAIDQEVESPTDQVAHVIGVAPVNSVDADAELIPSRGSRLGATPGHGDLPAIAGQLLDR